MALKSVKAIMVDAGVSGRTIALKLKVSPSAVSQVASKKIKSKRIQQAIADEVGISYEKLWGTAA